MKTYIAPTTTIHHLHMESALLTGTGSAGVQSGNNVIDEYSSTDQSYSRSASPWDSEE